MGHIQSVLQLDEAAGLAAALQFASVSALTRCSCFVAFETLLCFSPFALPVTAVCLHARDALPWELTGLF